MFLGRRFSSARPALNFREPLSFLYPRWARTAADYPAQHASIDSFGPVHSGKAPAAGEAEQEYATQVLSRPENEAGDGRPQNEGALPWKRDTVAIPETAQIATADSSSTRRIRRVVRRKKGRARDMSFDHIARGEVRGNARSKNAGAQIDWQIILRTLQLHTPSYLGPSRDRKLRIKIPVEVVEQLIFSVDSNIWKIKERYGCQVELGEQEDGVSGSCLAIVSGPAGNVMKAAAEILQIKPSENKYTQWRHKYPIRFNTQAPSDQISSSKDGQAMIKYRHVLADAHGIMASPLNVCQVTIPEVWTKSSFENYVRHLTTIKMSNHVHSILYKKGEHHNEMVIKALRRLFSDPRYTGCITITAANLALEYFVKKSQLRDVRALYGRLETMDLGIDTETYNIILRGAAKRKDLHTFQYFLELMLMRGYRPNGKTWIEFLRTLVGFEARKRTAAAMRRKGLFHNPGLIKNVSSLLARGELQDFLEGKAFRKSFWQHMETTYGKHWFGLDAANQILDELGHRDLIFSCMGILKFMNHNGVTPNTDSLNFVLKRCAANSNWRGAIKVLECISNITDVAPNDITYHSLFNLSWQYRFYNMARVVWQYACLDGATTDLMRERVKRTFRAALFNDPPKPINTATAFWKINAGSFILGRMPLLPPWKPLDIKGYYSDTESEPKVHVSTDSGNQSPQSSPLTRATPEQISLYKDILQQVSGDVRAFRLFSPGEPFIAILKLAISVDVQIGHQFCKDPVAIQRLISTMVTVPLIRKKSGLPGKPTMWLPGMRIEKLYQDSNATDGVATLELVGRTGDRVFYRRIKPKQSVTPTSRGQESLQSLMNESRGESG